MPTIDEKTAPIVEFDRIKELARSLAEELQPDCRGKVVVKYHANQLCRRYPEHGWLVIAERPTGLLDGIKDQLHDFGNPHRDWSLWGKELLVIHGSFRTPGSEKILEIMVYDRKAEPILRKNFDSFAKKEGLTGMNIEKHYD